jgi:hypothetical protein
MAAVYPIVDFDCLMVRVREDRSRSWPCWPTAISPMEITPSHAQLFIAGLHGVALDQRVFGWWPPLVGSYRRVSLETGAGPALPPARSLICRVLRALRALRGL